MSDTFTAYSPASLQAELAPASQALLRRLTILDVVDSTNLALQRLPLEEQHSHAVVADTQNAGRGRHGRRWHSPPGHNIYLSLGWNFQRPAGALTRLPLAAAVMAVRAMQRAGLRSTGIKWPNDIQIAGRKLAGILVELRSTGGKQTLAVIGIGVNVRMPEVEASRTAIGQPWTDVCTHLDQPAEEGLRNRLCGTLLDELLRGLEQYASAGFYAFSNEWSHWDALQGREVTILGADEKVSGTARGISDRGGLLVDCPVESGGVQVREFFAGDVSIRPL
jgi:BirA family biotin operon repressor/biotin-[acetyl-CoA-carboxylase] ligase